MKLTTKFFLSGVVIVCVVTVFFRGWHLAPKDGIEEIKRSDPVLRVSSFSKSSPIYQAAEDYRRWLSGDKKFSEKTGDLSLADKFLLSGRYRQRGVPLANRSSGGTSFVCWQDIGIIGYSYVWQIFEGRNALLGVRKPYLSGDGIIQRGRI